MTLRDHQGDEQQGIYHPASATGTEPLITVNGTTWNETRWTQAGWHISAWGDWEQ